LGQCMAGQAGLQSSELRTLMALLAFAVIWTVIVMPFIQTQSAITTLNPIFQYFLFNLGFIILSIVVFGIIYRVVKKHYDMKKAFSRGISAWFGVSFIYDMWSPPYVIDYQGNLVQMGDASAVNATVDMMWAFIFQSLFPAIATIRVPLVDLSMLYVAVYGLVPALTVLAMALIFTEGKFKKMVNLGGNPRKVRK